MSLITSKQTESNYVSNLGAFLEAAGANAEVFGLTAEELEMLQTEITTLDEALVAVVTARAALTAAAGAKDAQMGLVRGVVAMLAKSWRANPAIPDPVLDELMVAHHAVPRRRSAPLTPADVVLDATGGGLLTLRWKSGANIKGTVYQIEFCSSPDGRWVLLDTVTARKFQFQGEPGVPAWFRVRAKRGGRASVASMPVGMWAGLGFRAA